MRIAIVGAGGVGGLLGGLLARAGKQVLFVARGAHLEAIRQKGLHVDSPRGTFAVQPAGASEDPADFGGPADAVLVCVKAWQVPDIAPSLKPIVGPSTVVAPMQNGVSAADQLARVLGPDRVLGGLCYMLSWVEAPGQIRHTGALLRVLLGERRGGSSDRVERVVQALRDAQVDAEASANVESATWQKFMFIEPWGSVGAAARAPVEALRTTPETRARLRAAMEEIASVARARGVRLPEDAVDATLKRIDAMPPDSKSSMQRDLEAGRPSELNDQTGALVRLARDAGVPAPVHEALYDEILPLENAALSSRRRG